jgi:hypothetical protein
MLWERMNIEKMFKQRKSRSAHPNPADGGTINPHIRNFFNDNNKAPNIFKI